MASTAPAPGAPGTPGGPAALDDARGRPGSARAAHVKGIRLTQLQKDLVWNLHSYSGNAADSYVAALWICDSHDYADRPSHLAYAARDVVDHLARERQNDRWRRTGLAPCERANLLKRTFDPITWHGYKYEGHYTALAGAYDHLSDAAHKRNPDTDGVPSETLPEIERMLHDLSMPQAALNKRADVLMSKDPTDERARQLIGLISTGATLYYIIDRLPPRWLDCMTRAGFFDSPKKYRWIAHKYLQRCAHEYPGRVAGIITSYDPKSVRIDYMYEDLLDCALLMPATHAAKILKFLTRGRLCDLFICCPAKYLRVAANLCLGGKCRLAIDLARKVLVLRNINYPYHVPGWLDRPVREFADAVMKREPLPLLGLLADLLETLLTDRAGGKTDDQLSSMYHKRLTIEDSDHNVRDLESSLVAHMRNCLMIIGRKGRPQLLRATRLTGTKRLLIYRRLEMHAYGTFPDLCMREAEECTIRYLGNNYVRNEHYAMLHNSYCLMPARAKRKILEAIMGAGKGGSGMKRGRDSGKFLRLRYLGWIKEYLDDEHLVAYRDLLQDAKERDPEPARPLEQGRIRPERGPGPLDGKDAGQVIDIVRKYRPDPGAFPDRLLLGFSYLVKADPWGFSRRAMDLAVADPNVLEAFFRSMGGALCDGGRIDWNSTIGLIRHAGDAFSRDPSAANEEVALAACSLLDDGFRHAPPGIELLDPLRDVVVMMAEISAHLPDRDLQEFKDAIYSGRPIDTFNTSINSLGGISFQVLLWYALWHNARTETEDVPGEVRSILDKYASNRAALTISRNSMLGVYLPDLYELDDKWAKAMVYEVCPDKCFMIALWDGYVRSNLPHRGIFSHMHKEYVDFLTGDMAEILKDQETFKFTLDHALHAYLYRYTKSHPPLRKFLRLIKKDAPKDLIDLCINRVGMILRKMPDGPGFDVKRLEELWRNKTLSKRDLSDWFIGSMVDKKVSIRLYVEYLAKHYKSTYMLNLLLDNLNLYAAEFPEDVINSIWYLLDSPPNPDETKSVRRILDRLEAYRDRIGDMLDKTRERLDRICHGP